MIVNQVVDPTINSVEIPTPPTGPKEWMLISDSDDFVFNGVSESNSSLLATKTPSEPGDDDTFAGGTVRLLESQTQKSHTKGYCTDIRYIFSASFSITHITCRTVPVILDSRAAANPTVKPNPKEKNTSRTPRPNAFHGISDRRLSSPRHNSSERNPAAAVTAIEPLTGSDNFATWKRLMTSYLKARQVWDVVSGDLQRPDCLFKKRQLATWKRLMTSYLKARQVWDVVSGDLQRPDCLFKYAKHITADIHPLVEPHLHGAVRQRAIEARLEVEVQAFERHREWSRRGARPPHISIHVAGLDIP
ncbi:protein of unknown function DUF4219 [Penicillium italicum]|uniref:DUF4219 domain-containing protein n=1 Tax=Penicillium italicum TaxID=40296 RepID=A0A0A2KN87_PENIT|nr:protein of unknown function DUF4219 [Penicillium italicum]